MAQTAEQIVAAESGIAAPPAPESRYGLGANVLSSAEVLGQSIANIAPTSTPAVVIPLVFATAGDASWFAYLFALVAVLLVSVSINQFARRIASPGSIYSYVALGLGPTGGILVGWALLVAYIACGASVSAGFANYVNELAKVILHSPAGLSGGMLALVIAAGVGTVWWVARRDVRLSARLSLALELLSVVFILAVIGATLKRLGPHWDIAQLRLQGLTLDRLRLGLVLAIFSFTGFESAAALGSEAVNPLRTIPRAVLQSILFVGVMFIICAYTQVAGFRGGSVSLAASNAPLQDLANEAGIGALGIAITIGAVLSFFACMLACVTSAARVLLLMSRHGVFGASLGLIHRTHQTPYRAVTLVSLAAVLPAGALALAGYGMFDIYGLVGTTATLGFVVSYIAVCVAAPLFLRRSNALRARDLVAPAVAIALMLVALAGAIHPWPDAPGSYPIIVFFLLLGVGILYTARVALRRPGVHSDIRTDLTELQHEQRVGAP